MTPKTRNILKKVLAYGLMSVTLMLIYLVIAFSPPNQPKTHPKMNDVTMYINNSTMLARTYARTFFMMFLVFGVISLLCFKQNDMVQQIV